MSAVLKPYDPLVSQYESAEHEARHTAWIQAKVARSLADTRPNIPHAEVMAKIRALLDSMPTDEERDNMNAVLNPYDPLVSEFESAEDEASYTLWLQEQVDASLADTRPHVPHDEVMAKMDAIIQRYQPKAAAA